MGLLLPWGRHGERERERERERDVSIEGIVVKGAKASWYKHINF